MKRKTLVMMMFVFLLCFMAGCTSETETEVETEVITDVNDFSKISSGELVEKLGEPVRIEDFTAPNGAAGECYWYDIDTEHYDFYVVDDKVVELIVSSQKYWTGKGETFAYAKKNKSDIGECFNIKLGQDAKIQDKNITYVAENVSKTVDRINVQNIDESDKIYEVIRIIYDDSYFN